MANSIALNVYLLKKGRYPLKEIDLHGFKPAFEVRVGPKQTSMVYFKMSGGEPDWLKSLKSISSFAGNVGESKSPQAMIFVRSRQRWFVLTFGQAWQKVSNTEIVPDFGTRCVLNIALALIRGVPKERLPFFAKVGLASCVRSLRQMRFVVKYAKIT